MSKPKTKAKSPPPLSIYDGKPHRGEKSPVALTVGELKEALSRYPDNLPVSTGLNDGVVLVWFNVGQESEHLSVEENDGNWTDED